MNHEQCTSVEALGQIKKGTPMKVMEEMLKYTKTEYSRIGNINFYCVIEFCQLFSAFNNYEI
jgi:hypothetical protein